MKLLSYIGNGRTGIALDLGGVWRGLSEGDAQFPGTLTSLVAAGTAALEEGARIVRERGERVTPSDVQLLRPIEPGRIVCVGLNYADHARESGLPIPEAPTLFSRFASSVVGPEAPIMLPLVSRQLDFEGELAVVIGKAGRNISEDQALAHVAGYTCFNDGSLRDYQLRTPQWMIGKNFDRSGSFGPALVTADELPPGAAGLQIQTRLNGEVVQSSSTSELIFGVARLIAFLSDAFELGPGDIIATGTPAGVGLARTPPLWMKDGDICEVAIEGIGTLRNRIAPDN